MRFLSGPDDQTRSSLGDPYIPHRGIGLLGFFFRARDQILLLRSNGPSVAGDRHFLTHKHKNRDAPLKDRPDKTDNASGRLNKAEDLSESGSLHHRIAPKGGRTWGRAEGKRASCFCNRKEVGRVSARPSRRFDWKVS